MPKYDRFGVEIKPELVLPPYIARIKDEIEKMNPGLLECWPPEDNWVLQNAHPFFPENTNVSEWIIFVVY